MSSINSSVKNSVDPLPSSTRGNPKQNTVYGPLGVAFSSCVDFSGRLHQTKIIKEKTIQTDVVVFENIRWTYYEAINPLNRLIIYSPLWIRTVRRMQKIIFIRDFIKFIDLVYRTCWHWIVSPIYRALSFWDLKLIHEVTVRHQILPKSVLIYNT